MIMVVRLATTPLHRKIAIQKPNNIMINRLTNPWSSILLDKWRFNTNQYCEVLGDNFDSVSSETSPDATLQALSFHYSPLGYLKERAPQFINVIDK